VCDNYILCIDQVILEREIHESVCRIVSEREVSDQQIGPLDLQDSQGLGILSIFIETINIALGHG